MKTPIHASKQFILNDRGGLLLNEIGKSKLEVAFVLLAIFAALLSAFNTWQHVTIASLLPDANGMQGMMLGCGALFLSTVTWAAILRVIGMGIRLSLTLAFLVAHVFFATATYLPLTITQGYLALFGILGVTIGGIVVVRNLTLGLGLWCLIGLLMIPVLWSAIAFITFALPHANFFTVFSADRIDAGMVDLFHQRAYVQMIHNYGIPSVGINGLAYHNYHWLVAYPLSTLSDFSGIDVKKVHANMLPGFTGPVLIHGVTIGLVLLSSRLLHGLLAAMFVIGLYIIAVLVSPAIIYGLVFLTPSTAYSVALAAPLIGLFVWYLNGNLSQLKSWHFLVLGAFVLVVGLAKVNTMLQIAAVMGVLWCAFVLRPRNWLIGTLFASSCVLVAAVGSIYFVWEIWQHSLLSTSAPEAYKRAFQALPALRQAAILNDIQGSLIKDADNPMMSSFERQVFYKSTIGAGLLGLTLFSVLFCYGLRGLRKDWRYLLVVSFFVVLTYLLIIQRSVFGMVTPTQVQYIILPGLLIGICIFVTVVTQWLLSISAVKAFFSSTNSDVIVAAVVLVLAVTMLLAIHLRVTPKVRMAALGAVASNPGMLANEQGKVLLRRLTAPRVSTLGVSSSRPKGPDAVIRFWDNWNRQPLYQKSQLLQQFAEARQGQDIAVFIPATHAFWGAARANQLQNNMFWFQGATGLVLYRGKVEISSDFSKGLRGRGVSDFGAEAAALVSSAGSVFCWPRFEGHLIVDLDLNIVADC